LSSATYRKSGKSTANAAIGEKRKNSKCDFAIDAQGSAAARPR
jgi:hypothetical protein